jgi:hypothetical protein
MANDSEFIEHLSKEIETHTNAMMTFRTRIAFIVFLGPFVLLSSILVGTKRMPDIAKLTPWTFIAIGVLCTCYIVLGLVSGMIERGIWRQCNRWRAQIATLVARKDMNVTSESVQFSDRHLLLAYVIAFILFFLSFIAMIFLISSLFGQQI